jgi:hypothetical protein
MLSCKAKTWEMQGALFDYLLVQVTTAVVVIVVDLSDPGSVIPTLLSWLEQVSKAPAASKSLSQASSIKQQARVVPA